LRAANNAAIINTAATPNSHPDRRALLSQIVALYPFHGTLVDMVQESREPGLDGSSSRCVHSGEVGRQG
jgi:hypothetical protein